MNDVVVARRYRLGRRIGTGGMGRVWLAMDEVLRRQVAVKEVLLPESLTDDDAAELRLRTLREARTAGMVSHPNVIKVYDVIYAEDRPWIVMEYVESRSLAQVIKEDGPMTPEDTADIGLAILAALTAAHQAGVLHRDVKPGNVLLGEKRVVLTDFGLATFDDLGSALTASGIVHGSPQFIAPERALDGTSTAAADMWSLGATLYAAVEGRAPYARASSYATLTALATAPPDPPRHAGALKPVLHGLLRRNPNNRMTPDEVRSWLQVVADGDDGNRIPRQRRHVDPDPYGSGGSGSSRRRSSSGSTVPPVSHARRNRRQFTGNPSERMRQKDNDPGAAGGASNSPGTADAADRIVAGNPPAAAGSLSPPAFASGKAALVDPDLERERDTDHQMDLAWKLDAAAGKLTPTGADPSSTGSGRLARRRARRSRRMLALVSITCVFALAAGTVLVLRHHRTISGEFSPGATAGQLAWPCANTPAVQPSATVPAPASSEQNRQKLGGTVLTAVPGGRWYPVNGFETTVPIGWQIVKGTNITCFYQPGTSGVLGFETIVPTKTTASDELKAQAATFAAARGVAFDGTGIHANVADRNDAEWDFTFKENVEGEPQTMNALVYLIMVNAHLAYAFCVAATSVNWASRADFTPPLEISLVAASNR
jgi:serine/threonine protein kinase